MDKPEEKTAQALFRAFAENFRWDDVSLLAYKEEGSAPFKSITRQVLFQDSELKCELRYFEVAGGGYSTLERHEHTHGVMILRGAADVLVGGEVRPVKQFDLVRIKGDEPMGFLCMVNVERDKPQLPTAEEVEQLKSDPAVAGFLAT